MKKRTGLNKPGLIVFLFIAWIPHTAASSPVPPHELGNLQIQNYGPKTFKTDPQVWAAAQDARGVMYFGVEGNIIEFDGQNWRAIRVGDGTVHSLDVDKKGTVFIGSRNDLGYLAISGEGQVEFESLLHASSSR